MAMVRCARSGRSAARNVPLFRDRREGGRKGGQRIDREASCAETRSSPIEYAYVIVFFAADYCLRIFLLLGLRAVRPLLHALPNVPVADAGAQQHLCHRVRRRIRRNGRYVIQSTVCSRSKSAY